MVRAALVLLLLALPARAADLFIEAEIVPARVYVGGEARLILRLYRSPGVTHGTLVPAPLGGAADLSLLGPMRIYEAERAGAKYEVLERTHVLVPRQPGKLVVPGAQFEGALSYEVYNRATGTVPRTARGPERSLEVLPVPAGAGEPFLPARSLQLKESWSRDLDALSTGTPVTRTLVLQAEGLAAERLPRLEMPAHPSLLAHYDQPELATEYLSEGMVGRRMQRIVLMPVSAAEVALPEVSVRWWDVGSDAERVARLEAKTLVLHAALAPVAKPEEAKVDVPAVLEGVLVAILAGVGLWLFWYARTLPMREARRSLKEACFRNDARGARDALREWDKAAGAPAQLDREPLYAALYAGRAWEGVAFWRRAKPALRRKRRRRGKAAAPPLFRLQASHQQVPSYD